MKKIIEILSFIKDNLNGANTHIFLVAVFALIMFKILGFLGLLTGLIIVIGVDVCKTINLKKIYLFFKGRFFPIIVLGLMLVSCGTEMKLMEGVYGISQILKVKKDTVSAKTLQNMIVTKYIPSLDKCGKQYLTNPEEKKTNAYYVYLDSISGRLFNIKELVENGDTTYVVEEKILKK